MKKKLVIVLLILCLALTACRSDSGMFGKETEPQRESTVSPLLYRVTDQQGNALWLFGSIHVGTEDYYPLPDYVLNAFDGSDALAVEVDIMAVEWDFLGQAQLLQLLMYTDGTTISDHLPQETYDRAVAILQENETYSEALDYYMPAFWWSTVESLSYAKMGAQASLGVDRHLLKRARNDGKPVREVESAQLQYSLMAEFSPQLQQLLLEQSIYTYDHLDEAAEDIRYMMELWSAGDEAAFAAYLAEEGEITDPQEQLLYDEYNTALITNRNQTMTEYAEDALASGEEIFICVGAAHIVGEGAMAQNLRQLGYTVELITE